LGSTVLEVATLTFSGFETTASSLMMFQAHELESGSGSLGIPFRNLIFVAAEATRLG
jgi:hypothetical protein